MRRRLLALLDEPERGSASMVALVVFVLPVTVAFLAVLFFMARMTSAQMVADAAAAEAARAASIAGTAQQAAVDAESIATVMLADQDLNCTSSDVSTDTSGFAAPAGTPASTSVTVTCVVPLSDLMLPGVPGSQTVTATATSVLDTYRERS